MASIPNFLLKNQLDAALQIIIVSSHNMTEEQLIAFRVRLDETSIILGHVLAMRNQPTVNGKLLCLVSLLLP